MDLAGADMDSAEGHCFQTDIQEQRIPEMETINF